jgi:hypothetical protein
MQIIIAADVASTFGRRWNILVSQHEQIQSRNFVIMFFIIDH